MVAVVALLALAPASGAAQKVEREYGISRDEVPERLVAYLDSAFAERRREHFYRDEGEADTTLEAKFKLARAWYSVEFAPDGRWIDTEVEVPVDEVPERVWTQACGAWSRDYERYRVERVQHHRGRGGEEFYEVELQTRTDFEWDRYEIAIAPDGRVLEEKLIELAPGHLDRW